MFGGDSSQNLTNSAIVNGFQMRSFRKSYGLGSIFGGMDLCFGISDDCTKCGEVVIKSIAKICSKEGHEGSHRFFLS